MPHRCGLLFTSHKNQIECPSTKTSNKMDSTYIDRLLALKLIPLTYDREVKDLVFFYKALHGLIDF